MGAQRWLELDEARLVESADQCARVRDSALDGGAVARIAASDMDEIVVTDTIPLSEEAKRCTRIRQVSSAPLLTWRMRVQRFASSDSGTVSVTTSSSSTEALRFAIALPESTSCVK